MKTEVYDIKGMTCASCSAAVERVTGKLEGVESSQVNLATAKMTITYDESRLTPEQIIGRIQRAGFEAELAHDKKKEEQREEAAEAEEAQHKIRRRLILSIALAVPLLYLSMGHMLPVKLPLPALLDMHETR